MKKHMALGAAAFLSATTLTFAEETTTYRATEQTTTVTTTPTQETTVTNPAPGATDAKAAGPAQARVGEDVWGTVQSVDRSNRSLVLQDAHGKDFVVGLNDNTSFYRRGQQVDYRDIEPNDHIQVHYRS